MLRSTQPNHCAKCQQFPTEWPCPKSTTFNHHETFEDLDQSAESGCAMCRLLWQLLVFEAELGKLMASSCPVKVQISGRTDISVGLNSSEVFIGSPSDDMSVYGLLQVREGLGGSDEILLFESKIRGFQPADQDRELKDMVKSLIQPWVSSCCKGTTDQPSPNTPLPTRVIDVQAGQDHVRLTETSGQLGTYLILSYCWGKGNGRARTTQLNLKERHRAIQIKDLPPTIRQAIEVTRQLGFRYIWIDAICIIQAHSVPPKHDELEDWRREAPKMGQYYGNAVLTIAATAATDSEEGFVAQRRAQRYAVPPCPIGLWVKDGKATSEAFVIPGTPSDTNQVEYAPLYTRGWTLQERVLSPHTLHWGRECVFWECHGQCKASEARPALLSAKQATELSRYNWSTVLDHSRKQTAQFNEMWLDLVEDYGQMSLSFESDRLMAIQGLVDVLPPPNDADDVYIAGMFKSCLVAGLTWCNPNPPGAKVAEVPSWSWASLAGGDFHFLYPRHRFTVLRSASQFDALRREASLNGRLELSGPLREFHTNLIREDDGSRRIAILSKDYPFKVYFNFDSGGLPSHNGTATLLAVGWEQSWEGIKDSDGELDIAKTGRLVSGLVLWPEAGKVKEFKRIGCFRVAETAETTEWDDMPKQDIYLF